MSRSFRIPLTDEAGEPVGEHVGSFTRSKQVQIDTKGHSASEIFAALEMEDRRRKRRRLRPVLLYGIAYIAFMLALCAMFLAAG